MTEFYVNNNAYLGRVEREENNDCSNNFTYHESKSTVPSYLASKTTGVKPPRSLSSPLSSRSLPSF